MNELRLIPGIERERERESGRKGGARAYTQLARQSFRISKTHIYIKWFA